MNSTTATNTNTTTSTKTPATFAHSGDDRLARVQDQLAGFAALAQVCREMSEIHYTYDRGGNTAGLTQYVQAVQAQFAQAFVAAFPDPDTMQDSLIDATHEAVGQAKRAGAQTANSVTEAMSAAVEATPAPAQPATVGGTDWRAMLETHNGDMRGAMTEAGYGDPGTTTAEDTIETAACWAMRLATIDRLPMLIELARTLYAQGRADGRQPHKVE